MCAAAPHESVGSLALDAAFYRMAFELGIAGIDEVIAWADALVERDVHQPPEILDLTLAQRMPPLDVAHLIGELCEWDGDQRAARALLARLHRELIAGARSIGDTVALCKTMARRHDVRDALEDELYDVVHSFELAAEEAYGDFDVESERFIAWLSRFATAE